MRSPAASPRSAWRTPREATGGACRREGRRGVPRARAFAGRPRGEAVLLDLGVRGGRAPRSALLLSDRHGEGVCLAGLRRAGRLLEDRDRRARAPARLSALESVSLPRDADLRKPRLRALRLPAGRPLRFRTGGSPVSEDDLASGPLHSARPRDARVPARRGRGPGGRPARGIHARPHPESRGGRRFRARKPDHDRGLPAAPPPALGPLRAPRLLARAGGIRLRGGVPAPSRARADRLLLLDRAHPLRAVPRRHGSPRRPAGGGSARVRRARGRPRPRIRDERVPLPARS